MPTGPDDESLLWEAWAYANEKLGYLPPGLWPGAPSDLTDEEIAAWDEAVREYLDEHRERGNGTE